jgi:hypothetical protein
MVQHILVHFFDWYFKLFFSFYLCHFTVPEILRLMEYLSLLLDSNCFTFQSMALMSCTQCFIDLYVAQSLTFPVELTVTKWRF